MIFKLLIVLFGGVLFAVAFNVLLTVARTLLAYQDLKRRSKGLPMLHDFRCIGGHLHNAIFERFNWLEIEGHVRRYGKTICLLYGTKPCVLTVDLELIKTMTIDEPQMHVDRIKIDSPLREFEEDSIAFAEGDQWRRIRRILDPAFSGLKMKSDEVTAEVQSIIDKLVDSIEMRLDQEDRTGNKGCEMNADDLMARYALDLVLTCFYRQQDVVDFGIKVEPTLKIIDEAIAMMEKPVVELYTTFPALLRPVWYRFLLRFSPFGKMSAMIYRIIHNFTEQNVTARRQREMLDNAIVEDSTKRDGKQFKRRMLEYFIDEYFNGKLTKKEYLHTTFFLFLAGFKASSDSLSKILYYLACHQEAQEKLRKSILADGENSEYLTWFINETLRLRPPVLIGCSRRVTRDIEVDGGLVPKGTFVITPIFTIHRLPELWGADACEFKPERWADAKIFHSMQYLAFGAGKRHCPGKEFVNRELRTVTCALLRKFKFGRTEKTNDSLLFRSPYFFLNSYDMPIYISVARVETRE